MVKFKAFEVYNWAYDAVKKACEDYTKLNYKGLPFKFAPEKKLLINYK